MSVRNVFYTKRLEFLYETSDIFIRNVLYETSDIRNVCHPNQSNKLIVTYKLNI